MRRTTVFVFLALAGVPAVSGQTTHLNQGWTEDEREEFYFTPQGSQLIPYDWFLSVEQKNSTALFRDQENMRRYGILTASSTPRNPDGLPIGFVRDGVDSAETSIAESNAPQQQQLQAATQFNIKKAYLGSDSKESLYPKPREAWFGLTCAACHTHEMDYNGKTIRIDGGTTQADLESFLRDLGGALEATHQNPEKLARFAERVGRAHEPRGKFHKEVKQIADAVNRLVERNKAKHSYGYGRLDAFGAILNAVCETALNEPGNRRESNAPVSYPSLWNTPHMSHVQWGATADWPEVRNVGEVLGVFGCYTVDPGPEQFDSTVRLKNLIRLEHDILTKLRSPDWPENILGTLDAAKIEQGQNLFRKNCQSCHPVRGDNGQFARNEADRIQATSNTVQEVGTDPLFLKNLSLQDLVSSGVLKPMLGNQDRVPRLAVLSAVVKGIMTSRAKAEAVDIAALRPHEQPLPHPNGIGSGYISRPLEGIWASAPYFHNGSVPSLYETLLPSAKRSTTFSVGAREFDPVNVGYVMDAKGAGKFRVVDDRCQPIPGNSNAGHEGHGAAEDQGFTETFEDGAWREFTNDERYALVEYMKSLSSKPVTKEPAVNLENIPDDEAERIAHLVEMTTQRMTRQYAGGKRLLRGVHPKDHGCVTAKFEVLSSLPKEYSVGVFRPGASYEAFIRFSNASAVAGPDSSRDEAGAPKHGSRGMAIKLMGVEGESLLPLHGALTQDFLMVNQPAFAFAKVLDYEIFTASPGDGADKFKAFAASLIATGSPGAAERVQRTGQLISRISASAVDGEKGAFEEPPSSPVDNAYFGAATFLFGEGRVMRFRARPVERSVDPPLVDDPNYLRTALIRRLQEKAVEFEFSLQVRTADQLDIEADIENVSSVWPDEFVPVARITIPPQEFDSPEQRVRCERLFFTPWHGIVEHRPLGGINRMRKAVYLSSAQLRNLTKEPVSLD